MQPGFPAMAQQNMILRDDQHSSVAIEICLSAAGKNTSVHHNVVHRHPVWGIDTATTQDGPLLHMYVGRP